MDLCMLPLIYYSLSKLGVRVKIVDKKNMPNSTIIDMPGLYE